MLGTWTLGKEAGIVRVMLLNTWEGGWDSGSSCWEAVPMGRLGKWIFMLGTWEGGWDSGSSC